MSYLRYKAEFKDVMSEATFAVELFGKEDGSVHNMKVYSSRPLVYTSSGQGKDGDRVVAGSSMDFEFVAYRGDSSDYVDSISDYQPIIDSGPRDWEMRVKKGGSEIWRGYVQPDMISHRFIEHVLVVRLSATDGLKDLSEIPFVDSDGSQFSGRKKILEIVKFALEPLGFNLNFRIKLSTREERQDSSDLGLHCTLDARRFADVNCLEAIDICLRPFNVILAQYGAKYNITNIVEKETVVRDYSWESLDFQDSKGAAPVLDITSHEHFIRGGHLSKMTPLRKVSVLHYNRNFGDTIVDDLDDFSATWDYEFGIGTTPITGGLEAHMFPEDGGPEQDAERTMTLKEFFPVAKLTDSDFVRLSFQFRIVSYSGMELSLQDSFIRIRLGFQREGDDTVYDAGVQYMTQAWQTYPDLSTPVMNYLFAVTQSGNYNVVLKVEIGDTEPMWDAVIQVKDFDITRFSNVDGEVESDITFDRLYTGVNPSGKVSVEKEVWIGDSLQPRDIGAVFLPTGENTASWKTSQELVSKSGLIHTYISGLLNLRKKYNEYVNVDLIGDYSIYPGGLVKIGDKVYLVDSSSKEYYRRRISLVLIERYDEQDFTDAIDQIPVNDAPISDSPLDAIFTEPHPIFPIDFLKYRKGAEIRDVTDLPKKDGVIAGGEISWKSGLEFSVGPVAFYLNKELYVIEEARTVVLDPGGAKDRIDVITADVDLSVGTVKGTEADVAIAPSPAHSQEVQIAQIRVRVGQTEADVDQVIVYLENDEWSTSSQGLTANFDATSDPFQGTKHIDVEPWSPGGKLIFSDTARQMPNVFSFAYKLKSAWGEDDKLVMTLKDGATVVGQRNIRLSSLDWDVVNIPGQGYLRDAQFDTIEIEVQSVVERERPGFLLDRFVLQYSEDIGQPSPVYEHPRGFEDQPQDPLEGFDVISQVNVTDEGHLSGVQTRQLPTFFKYKQDETPDPTEAGEKDMWFRPVDMKIFEIVTAGGVQYWAETTSPKFE